MNGSAWRWTGASIIGRKLAIQDDMDYKGQHWFRKARKKRHYESLVLVSSAEGQVEKRAQTSYHPYSIPPKFLAKPLIIAAGDQTIEILCDNEVIATHLRSYDRERFIECKEHRQKLLDYGHFGRTNLFRENLVADFPAVDKILEKQFERGLDMATLVRHLYEIRYSHGDYLFAEAVNTAVESNRYSTESLRVILQQIEAKQKDPARVSVHLPDRKEVKSLEIEKRPLSTYDRL